MKKTMLIVVLAALMNSSYADDMATEEVIKTLKGNGLTSLVDLYTKGALVLDTDGTTVNKMQLKRNGASYHDAPAAAAKFWYRGMGIVETNQLIASGYSRLDWNVESFLGIAPEFSYSKGYLTIKNPGVVVEFGTDNVGWLFKQWSIDNKCQVKAEGGGTFGLGLTGSIRSCDLKKLPPNTTALGEVFSDWMGNTTITTRIVWVLVPRV